MTTTAPTRRPTTPAEKPLPPLVQRTWRIALAVAFVAVAFIQAPGRVVADTKLDLVVDPARFLGRSLLAWDPHAGFGQLQNQAYGYLFPMGPFYLLGHVAGVPDWVVQRAWWALLLVIAYEGLLALADELGIGTPTTRLMAAAAFALSPRVLSSLGALSVESWPLALAPWILLPLVRASSRGDPRRSALTSALLFACVGAVNAAATIAALLPAALWLASRRSGPRRRQLVTWWVAGIGLASVWWVLPLLILARYAYPFLDYIESARTTTSVTSVPNVLRGVSDWVAYSPSLGEPTWPAGWALATHPALILATTAVAALGLLGSATRSCPERRFLAWSVAAGVVLMAVGHCGPLAGPVRGLLDGPLVAFRNVHKVEPVLRIAVSLGLAHALAMAPGLLRAGWSRVPPGWGLPSAPVVARASAGAATVIIVVSSWPAWAGELAPRAPFAVVPGYWQTAATWLDTHPDGRTLLVPGSSFGDYRWGHTNDEPLEALAKSSMAVRDAVPLGAPGATRLLDGVDSELAGGRPSAGLAGALARAGIGRLLLRNDLDPRASADPLAVIRATLAGSPGIRRVATFGPPLDGTEGRVADLVGSAPARLALEIWDVEARSPDITVPVLAAARRLGGGPEAATAFAPAGLDSVPMLDVGAGTPGLTNASAVVTDTLRRRELDFGSVPGSGYGPTLPGSAPVGSGRAAGDILAGSPAAQTVARFAGDASVRSSPSAADPRLAGWRGPGAQPAAAFDGDPDTAWISADTGGRRWLQVSWPTPHRIATLRIVPSSITSLARPERVRVTTDAGSVTSHADATGTIVVVSQKAPTRRVRIDLLGAPVAAQVAIAEVVGLEVPERLVLPRETPVDAGHDTVLLTRSPDRGSCVLAAAWLCSQRLARPGEDAATWRRELTVSARGETEVRATVRARPGPELDHALDTALGYATTGSSVAVDHPAARPGAALDGDNATAWISSRNDPAPTLTVTYPQAVTISQLGLSTDEQSRSGLRSIVVAAGSRRQVVGLGGRRLPTFAPITAQTFRFTFVRSADRTDPIRVEELVLPGVNAPPADARVQLPCGRGPSLEVGSTRIDLAVDASATGLVSGASIPATVCGGARAVLGIGHQQVVADATSIVAPQTVSMGPTGLVGAVGELRSVRVRRNDAEHRVVAVGGGPIALVVLDEGSNAGWRAMANGHLLRPATVDRWRQAFVLPSGGPAVVDITFAPGHWHRIGLVVGGLALLLLLGFRLALAGSRSGADEPIPGCRPLQPRAATAAVLTLVIGGVLGGGVGVGVALAAVVARRRRRVALGIAAALYAVAGVAATRSSELSGGGTAGWTALGGLLVVFACAVDAGGPAWRRRHRPAPPIEQGLFEQVPGEAGG